MHHPFLKLVLLLVASFAGLVTSTLGGALLVDLFNPPDPFRFPAPVIAFMVFALPTGLLLFFVQIGVFGFEFITHKTLGDSLLVIGLLAGGLIAGLVAFLRAGSGGNLAQVFAVVGLGVLHGVVVFGCQWLAAQLKIFTVQVG